MIGGLSYRAHSDVEIVSLDGTSNKGCKSIPDLPRTVRHATGMILPNLTLFVCGDYGTRDCFSYSGGPKWTIFSNVLNLRAAKLLYIPHIQGVLITNWFQAQIIYPNNMTVVDAPDFNISSRHHCSELLNDSFSILVDHNNVLGYNWMTRKMITLNLSNQTRGENTCAKTWKYLYAMGAYQNSLPTHFADRLKITNVHDIETEEWKAVDHMVENRQAGGGVAFANRPYYLGGWYLYGAKSIDPTRTIFRLEGDRWVSNSSIQLTQPRADFAIMVVPNSMLNC